ncbi:hypothetical protein BANRA_05022 [Escherichia coli]|nr:hypothetical protein BANRA_05022 [Escherichia coli]
MIVCHLPGQFLIIMMVGRLHQNIPYVLLRSRWERVHSPATERETVSITIRKPSSVFIDHDTFVNQGFYSRLNQGVEFRDKEDELSLMFKDNCFERFVPECLVKVKRWCFAGTGR